MDPNGPPSALWQEKSNIEVNIAVLHSFQQAHVSVVDHHTAAAGFLTFWESEHSQGRGTRVATVNCFLISVLSCSF